MCRVHKIAMLGCRGRDESETGQRDNSMQALGQSRCRNTVQYRLCVCSQASGWYSMHGQTVLCFDEGCVH